MAQSTYATFNDSGVGVAVVLGVLTLVHHKKWLRTFSAEEDYNLQHPNPGVPKTIPKSWLNTHVKWFDWFSLPAFSIKKKKV